MLGEMSIYGKEILGDVTWGNKRKGASGWEQRMVYGVLRRRSRLKLMGGPQSWVFCGL